MKKRLHIPIFLLLFVMVAQEATAQYYRNQGYWRKNRWQLHMALGASNFLGELGGRDRVGSDFIWDLEGKEFKPAATFGLRYYLKPKLSMRLQGSYAIVAGDDALTNERFRSNRNLHFRSPIYEVACLVEANLHTVRPGHRYNLAGVRGKKPRAANLYGFAGIGAVYFNPQAALRNTPGGPLNWYNLRELGTEGQNLDPNDDNEPYSQVAIIIPMGVGYRSHLANNMMIGIEIGHRMTFTDYMDDVSTTYYGTRSEIIANSPANEDVFLEAYFSDPSLGYYVTEGGEQIPETISLAGEQRGDETDNDAYLFAQMTLSYKFSGKPYRRRSSGAKRKGRRVVF